MSVINTNISSLIGLNNLRLTNNGLQTSLERLSSGIRINRGADDPSGLSISKIMEAQINGVRVAVQNAEDDISLIHTADGGLSETQDILMRMRDLAVRASNGATWTTQQMSIMNDEFQVLKSEITRKAAALTFNTKGLLTGAFSGQIMQIGQNNTSQYQISITIATTYGSGLGSFFVSAAVGGFSAAGANSVALPSQVSLAVDAISIIQSAIDKVSYSRSYLGIQENRLLHIIDDLKAEDTNVSAAKSRIFDADMAVEIAEFTKLQILQQSGTAILAQANAQPQSILQLLR